LRCRRDSRAQWFVIRVEPMRVDSPRHGGVFVAGEFGNSVSALPAMMTSSRTCGGANGCGRDLSAASHAGCNALCASVLRCTGVVPVSLGNTQLSAVGGHAGFHRFKTATARRSGIHRLPAFVRRA
jgi:hypothetical protein